jgi:ubiquinone/menaquinone biosynthesis C-methylase UbiE
MEDAPPTYIPALKYHCLTPLYDGVLRLFLRDHVFKSQLIRQARISEGAEVLDLGCGTATLTIMIKQAHPRAQVFGLDIDPAILRLARVKARRAGTEIRFDQGNAVQLPYEDRSFDRILSSLFFHHLETDQKQRAARELARVLRSGGELHIVDFGKPHTRLMRAISLVVGRLEQAADNVAGRLPVFLEQAGFTEVAETAHHPTLVGTLSCYRAVRL